MTVLGGLGSFREQETTINCYIATNDRKVDRSGKTGHPKEMRLCVRRIRTFDNS